jgi:hypothetical protein
MGTTSWMFVCLRWDPHHLFVHEKLDEHIIIGIKPGPPMYVIDKGIRLSIDVRASIYENVFRFRGTSQLFRVGLFMKHLGKSLNMKRKLVHLLL